MAGIMRHNLGALKDYHDSTGTTRFLAPPQNGISEEGEYQATADFVQGSATVDV